MEGGLEMPPFQVLIGKKLTANCNVSMISKIVLQVP